MAATSDNKSLYALIDPATRESVEYIKNPKWWDGSPVTSDSQCDGIIYRKYEGEYVKRVYSGPINLGWLGIKGDYRDDNPPAATNNYPAIQVWIDKIPPRIMLWVEFPPGYFYLSQGLLFRNRPWKVTGQSWGQFAEPSQGTRLKIGVGSHGLEFVRNVFIDKPNSIYDSHAQGFHVANLNVASAGGLHPAGYRVSGIRATGRIRIENCTMDGFSAHGMDLYGTTGDFSNVDSSLVQYNRVQNCGRDGVHLEGDDANAVNICFNDCVDNGGVGYNDKSFLGNNFIGNHANNNAGGHYRVEGANAYSVILGCYGEGGSPRNYINPLCPTIVIGGIHDNGWVPEEEGGGGFIMQGNRVNSLRLGQGIGLGPKAIDLLGNVLENTSKFGEGARTSFFADAGGREPIWEAVSANSGVSLVDVYSLGKALRSAPVKSMVLAKAQWRGDQFSHQGAFPGGLLNMPYQKGDVVLTDNYESFRPKERICVKPGRPHALAASELTVRNLAAVNRDGQITDIEFQDAAAYAKVRVGDLVTVPSEGTYPVLEVEPAFRMFVFIPEGQFIRQPDRVDLMFGAYNLQPTDYVGNQLELPAPAVWESYTAGQNVFINNDKPTTILSVVDTAGRLEVEIAWTAAIGYNHTDGDRIGFSVNGVQGDDGRRLFPQKFSLKPDGSTKSVTIYLLSPNVKKADVVYLNKQAAEVARVEQAHITLKRPNQPIAAGTQLTIEKPQFHALGNGSGLIVQRPSTSDMAGLIGGWPYYASDEEKGYVWTSSTFKQAFL